MSTIDFRGLVLKEQPAGESGKRILVLRENGGQVWMTVRGAKNIRGKVMAACQSFCFSRFWVFEGRGFWTVTRAELIESFYGLREELDRLAYGSYLLSLVTQTAVEGEMADQQTLPLLLQTLAVLEKDLLLPRLTAMIFTIKYLQMSGFLASSLGCVCCGAQETMWFSLAAGGFLCASCEAKWPDRVAVPGAVVEAFRFVERRQGSRIFGFRLSEEAEQALTELLRRILWARVGEVKALNFALRCSHPPGQKVEEKDYDHT